MAWKVSIFLDILLKGGENYGSVPRHTADPGVPLGDGENMIKNYSSSPDPEARLPRDEEVSRSVVKDP